MTDAKVTTEEQTQLDAAKNNIKLLLESLIKALVDNPDKANISIFQGEQTCVFEVRVCPTDIGKIVGKQGKMAQALRTLLMSLSAKNRVRGILEIVD